jgi:glycosyltransferase involved in cell wall biosynthesis
LSIFKIDPTLNLPGTSNHTLISANSLPSFSVLISVYNQEQPERLKVALESIWNKQALKPSEIVLVKDGPLTDELDKVVDQFKKNAPLKVISLEQNHGLGYALAYGLSYCSHGLIARMDSDDLSKPDRFEKQISFMNEHPEMDIVGTNIEEFDHHPGEIRSHRRLPTTSSKLKLFSRMRSPFNHMTVVFKKTAVLDAGNYQPFHVYEDYYLWVRMIQNGAKMANIPEYLVTARLDDSQLVRRHGSYIFQQEMKLQKEMLQIHFLNKWEYFRNLALRAYPRLLPFWVLKIIYKVLH